MAKESHDQKRRRKLEQRKRRERQAESAALAGSLAYMGDRYKTEKLIPSLMHAEIGIYHTYVITDRQLLDQTVISAIERLINGMRSGTLPPLPEGPVINYSVGREEDLLIEEIRRSWSVHFAEEWQPPQSDLIGVLRSILGSIEKVKAPGSQSQAYLRHIEGFLTKKLGVSVKEVREDQTPVPEPEEDELVLLGRRWYSDGDQEARAEFFELATHLRRTGEVNRVINASHLLVGEISDASSEALAELMDLIHQLRLSLMSTMS